ncbi:hypothetical protein ACDX66_00805 [Peribacillus frigoritolerans]
MSVEWKRADLLEHFTELYIEVEELEFEKFGQKRKDKTMSKEDTLMFRATKRLSTHAYACIGWLLAQEEEEIKCPQCKNGYAAVDVTDTITCDNCEYYFYPREIWFKDKEIDKIEILRYLSMIERWKEFDEKKVAFQGKRKVKVYGTLPKGYDTI